VSKKSATTFAALACTVALGVGVTAQTIQVNGAGATFPNPIYSKWFAEYNKLKPNVRINYQPIGSGGGIRQVTAQTVFFGATDGPMTQEQLAAVPGRIVHLPTVLGADVPVYNLPGVSAELKFTGPVLADIFLGKITKWNDPALVKLNPGVKLPATDVTVVHRSDGSGTTYIWVDFLAKTSPEWKKRVGVATSVNWPTGVGGKGNEGVSAFVQRLPNAIGYVEYAYAKQNKMSYVLLRNKDGAFVAPDDDTFKAAAAGADWSKSFYQVLTEQPGKDSWPITGATFILMHKAQDKPASAVAALKFFDWSYAQGDKTAGDLDYVPLPPKVKDLARKLWADSLKDSAGKPLAVN
jgi:phosphate transport system substrate-binding protein